jgi:hypothetical protein
MQEMFIPSLIEIGQIFHLKDSFQYTNVKNQRPERPQWRRVIGKPD